MSAPDLTASELRDVIHNAFDPVLSAVGFEWVSGSKWVRSDAAPIRHVVEAQAGRWGSRATHWGVSLDYVPHLVGQAVRWHRSAKGARLDLGYDPHNFRDSWDFKAQDWTISPNLGYPTPAERAASIASLLSGTALPWLDAVTDSFSLIAAFEREQARRGGQFDFDNYVQYRLAFAFTLARQGNLDRATSEFERWALHKQVPVGAQRQLLDLLAGTAVE